MEKLKELFFQAIKYLKSQKNVWEKPFWRPRRIFLLLGIIALFLLGQAASGYFSGPIPTITLLVPKENETVFNDELYIRGIAAPLGSKVMINSQPVSLNGDGTFTAIVKIQEGQNVIRVNAQKGRKQAEFLRLVKRELTEEERRSRQEAQAKDEAEAKAKILSKNQEISQVQSAYTQREAQKVRVIEHALKEEYGIKRIIGKLVNDTDKPAYWVKVTTSLLDKQGGKVEEKLAFVTSFDKFLKPGEEAAFETQSIEKEFDHYQLDVTWEKE